MPFCSRYFTFLPSEITPIPCVKLQHCTRRKARVATLHRVLLSLPHYKKVIFPANCCHLHRFHLSFVSLRLVHPKSVLFHKRCIVLFILFLPVNLCKIPTLPPLFLFSFSIRFVVISHRFMFCSIFRQFFPAFAYKTAPRLSKNAVPSLSYSRF